MASFLDTMAGSLYAGFRGKLHKGVIRRTSGGTGSDSHGRPTSPTPSLFACEGFIDDYDDVTRAAAGIPVTDVRVSIFGASIKPATIPILDDMVRIDAKSGSRWVKLRDRIKTDPARALYTCQAYEISAPIDA